jgi:PAS domain S-box-containing protein
LAAFEKGTSEGEAWLVAKNGEKFYCYLKGVRFVFEHGPCILGMAIDISKRKRAEEQIRLQSAALECVGNGVVITDTSGTIQWVNPEFTRLTGYSLEEAIGKNPRILKSGEQDQIVYKDLWETILSGKVWAGELKNLRKDGQLYVEEMTIAPVRAVTGEITNFVAIKQDVTERKRIEAELVKARDLAEVANRAKSDFLANMSHEIRTPMNGIIGMTELALDTHLTEEQHDYLGTVKQSAEALLNVINDVLDFSKIEAGKMDLEVTAFSLQELLGETMKCLALRAREKKLDLRCDLANGIPPLMSGDPLRLRQILLNLVCNAIKFTERGEIAVSAEVHSTSDQKLVVHFQVRDTGVGIPADKLTYIFQPFSQADSSTTRKYGGTGLGLTISARIVEMMHGRMWVESEPGQGSTFHFTAEFAASGAPAPGSETDSEKLNEMPTVAVDGASPAGTQATSSAPESSPQPEILAGQRGLRILLAEDNAINRRLAVHLLEKAGHMVEVAENGSQALAMVKLHRFDVVLMDVQMPEMDGLEATAAIRNCELHTHAHIPIIAMTAHAMKGDRERCLQAGMDGYISKPINRNELLALVAEHAPPAHALT